MRKLNRIQLLIIDDLALHPLGTDQTNDFYELIVERHRQHSTIITSNREGPEILSMMADQLLGQSTLDRLQSTLGLAPARLEQMIDAHAREQARQRRTGRGPRAAAAA